MIGAAVLVTAVGAVALVPRFGFTTNVTISLSYVSDEGRTYSCTYDYRTPNRLPMPDAIAEQMNEHDWSKTGQLIYDWAKDHPADSLAGLGEVAVWSFDLSVWGECAQAASEGEALARFARRVGVAVADLEVHERITGPAGVFAEDLLAADDEQISRTLEVLDAERARTLALLSTASEADLDEADPSVRQPDWMSWRTPRAILRHIADTESRTYPRWCGLPELQRVPDLREELDRSAQHIRNLLTTMPRMFQTEHHGEAWTPVKLLRRLAWHERIELIFLRRRLAQR